MGVSEIVQPDAGHVGSLYPAVEGVAEDIGMNRPSVWLREDEIVRLVSGGEVPSVCGLTIVMVAEHVGGSGIEVDDALAAVGLGVGTAQLVGDRDDRVPYCEATYAEVH